MDNHEIPDGSRAPHEVLDQLRSALAGVGSMGVRVNPSGRLAASLRVLEQVVSGERADPFERSQAHLDSFQLSEIGRYLLREPSPGVVEKLRLLVSDPLVEPATTDATPGRDAQFELNLAAQFAAGDLAISFEEPDFVVRERLLSVGIASKRLRSAKQLDRRLNEARVSGQVK